MPRLSHRLHTLEFGAIVLIVLTLVLFWLGQLSFNNFKENQATLVNITIMNVTNRINYLLKKDQQYLNLFVEHHKKELQELAAAPQNKLLYTQIYQDMQEFFPLVLAFSLSNKQGQTLLDKLNHYNDEMCLEDLRSFSQNKDKLKPLAIKIHPNPLGYHYNIATTWGDEKKSGLLLVNQRPDKLTQLLRNVQLSDYELILIDRSQQDLIELTAHGSRSDLPLDQFHLNAENKRRIVASHRLDNSHWHLLILHKRGLYQDQKQAIWNQSLLIFFLFAAVILLMSWWSDKLDSKRHQAVKALQQNEARYRAIVQDQTDLICRYSPNGLLSFVNHAYCRYFVKTQEELLGKPFQEPVLSKDQDYLQQQLSSLNAEQPITLVEYRVRLQNGRIHWQQWAIRGLYEEDQLIEIQAVGRDISEQKQTANNLKKAKEVAETSIKFKNEFLSNMSHEIRTPMNGIIGMTELLLNTDLNNKQKEYALTVSRSASSLLSLMDDILDFSQLDSGHFKLQQDNINLQQFLRDVQQNLHLKAEQKNLSLRLEYDQNLPKRIYTDNKRLRQVLINLISNAIKFTEQGYILIKLDVAKIEQTNIPQVNIRFEIKDTGIGIPSQYLSHIFTGFNQANLLNTKHFSGTGLGLSISYRLIKLMGGKLQVNSQPEQGSCFYFHLPFHIAPPRVEAAAMASMRSSINNTRILLVDDNPIDRHLFGEQLNSLKVRYDVVSNAETALHYLRNAHNESDPYWLILIDYRMPIINGYQLGMRIRQNSQYDKLCLFLISYAIETPEIDQFKQLGFSGFLQKPIQYTQLNYSLEVLRAAYIPQHRPPLWQDFYLQYDDNQIFPTTTYEQLPNYSDMHILLVEDNEINRTVASNMIQQLGCQIDIAINGRIAVDKWQDNHYDLIFMDIQMPEMDGLAATSKIRDLEKKQQISPAIPIVAVTANALPGDTRRCFDVGMNEVIAKPFGFDDIYAAVEKFCKNKQASPTTTQTKAPNITASLETIEDKPYTEDIVTPKTDQPVFDDSQLRRVVIGNLNLLKKIVEIFQLDTQNQLDKLETLLTSIDTNDIEQQRQIERIMHSLKGEARNIGAVQMGEIAYQGELAAKDQQWQQAQAVIPDLKQSFSKLQQIWAEIDWDNFLE